MRRAPGHPPRTAAGGRTGRCCRPLTTTTDRDNPISGISSGLPDPGHCWVHDIAPGRERSALPAEARRCILPTRQSKMRLSREPGLRDSLAQLCLKLNLPWRWTPPSAGPYRSSVEPANQSQQWASHCVTAAELRRTQFVVIELDRPIWRDNQHMSCVKFHTRATYQPTDQHPEHKGDCWQ
jgi:hypothetical protein